MKESDECSKAMMQLKETLDNWNPQPTMYLMVGLPRSGKSTWIKERIENLNAIVLENDWIRENILHAPHSKSIDPTIWMLTDGAARIILSQGKNVIIDGVNLTKFTRKFFIDMARECNARVVIVEIKTPIEKCIDRNRNVAWKLPEKALKVMGEKYELPMPDECDKLIIVDGE
jgi:predicted kinase